MPGQVLLHFSLGCSWNPQPLQEGEMSTQGSGISALKFSSLEL